MRSGWKAGCGVRKEVGSVVVGFPISCVPCESQLNVCASESDPEKSNTETEGRDVKKPDVVSSRQKG